MGIRNADQNGGKLCTCIFKKELSIEHSSSLFQEMVDWANFFSKFTGVRIKKETKDKVFIRENGNPIFTLSWFVSLIEFSDQNVISSKQNKFYNC